MSRRVYSVVTVMSIISFLVLGAGCRSTPKVSTPSSLYASLEGSVDVLTPTHLQSPDVYVVVQAKNLASGLVEQTTNTTVGFPVSLSFLVNSGAFVFAHLAPHTEYEISVTNVAEAGLREDPQKPSPARVITGAADTTTKNVTLQFIKDYF